ncbi:MAG TPA: hypothetical protein VJI96_03685 [Candidatus Andersenbacteria bacterium]|nr:hypothetical protein [Candidatus Andersenbacteria bacterium]
MKPVHQHNKQQSPQHKTIERIEHDVEVHAKKDSRFQHELAEMQEERDLRKVDDDVEDIATLFEWKAPEHIHQVRSAKWFATFAGGITAIAVGFALFKNFIASLTIGLIGGYMFVVAQHKPSIIRYRLMTEGVALNNTLYHYKHLEAFNIIYEPGNVKTVILRSSRRLVPLIHMEIGDADPVAIRDILVEFIHEDVHLEEPVIDIWARRLGF